MKTIKHPFTLDIYHMAKANPDKYRFVYRDGGYPLGVVYMEGCQVSMPVISWEYNSHETHDKYGFFLDERQIKSKDLFIEEILPRTHADIEAEIAALQEELNQIGGDK
jgi:hypothetical protein